MRYLAVGDHVGERQPAAVAVRRQVEAQQLRAPQEREAARRVADEAARNAAGWHVCLDKLGGAGSEWEPYYEEYQRRGLPAGAEIPGQS